MPRMDIDEQVSLAPLTTLGIGGPARYLVRCRQIEQIFGALEWAATESIPVHVLGGGSNTLFSDAGLDGLVLRIELAGVDTDMSQAKAELRVAAGQDWDGLVQTTIASGMVGLECLSGIPGYVGATPIQNVGAYGQEVSDVLVQVEAIDRTTLKTVVFDNEACEFAYRDSRFKGRDRDRYIVTRVTYRLERDTRPTIRYPELAQQLQVAGVELDRLDGGRAAAAVRDVVLGLRRSKAMVVDPSDPNTRSAGSFFLNPILTSAQYEQTVMRWRSHTGDQASEIPSYPSSDSHSESGHKLPAAWLVEQAGFVRGTQHSGAAVSDRHALALVSRSGKEQDLLALAHQIQRTVEDVFGVRLQREPVRVAREGTVLPSDDNEPRS
ncbi:MAG: UDP-N-acetylmuramate dehydrogenase [Candidatus Latescibacteria bacterium]|nr:UDP-N-acetylmuramate dehydrogenase [Candidatus Latescibacterota bacterium]MEE3042729.1 UDP-N-acetylmuramate dehydrogenase [Candidatus Latescibacterota bacterium]